MKALLEEVEMDYTKYGLVINHNWLRCKRKKRKH